MRSNMRSPGCRRGSALYGCSGSAPTALPASVSGPVRPLMNQYFGKRLDRSALNAQPAGALRQASPVPALAAL